MVNSRALPWFSDSPAILSHPLGPDDRPALVGYGNRRDGVLVSTRRLEIVYPNDNGGLDLIPIYYESALLEGPAGQEQVIGLVARCTDRDQAMEIHEWLLETEDLPLPLDPVRM